MPDGKKKMISSKETGTIPRVKYWNNTAAAAHDTHVANNLTSSMLPNQERSHTDSRNRQRCANYHCFEGLCMEDSRFFPNYNSLPYINMSGGTTSPSTSGSTSRRHSGGAIRKCDNITKYPDKKQIEEKLNQIREYLKVTSSLMSSVKEDQSNGEEADDLYEMLSALRDSESKLEALLVNREVVVEGQRGRSTSIAGQETVGDVAIEVSENGVPTLDSEPIFPTIQNNVACQRPPRNELELEEKMEMSEKKLQALHEQQNLLMRLQEKAENQMKDARKAQERLAACANSVQYPVNQQQQQMMMMMNSSTTLVEVPNKNLSDKNRCVPLPVDIESQAEQLGLTRHTTTNEGRGQLLRLLDARDNELCTEQQTLQKKLHELNSKKQQIDQLVSQLHCYGDGGDNNSEDGDDMANQIRQIVAMKEQLATLKDMLSAVKSTEAALLQQNSVECGAEAEEQQIAVGKAANVGKAVGSVGLSDVDARSDADRRWSTMGKQSNKSSMSSSREQLQAELQAKKQELEELMYKDQDRTSAINQDVCNEIVMNKGEPSFSLGSVPSSWTLLQDNTPPRDSCASRENVYSSDEEDLENYSQMNNTDTAKQCDYVHSNFVKQVPNRPVPNCNLPLPDAAVSSPSVGHNFNSQWSGVEQKQQMELMTNLCQSLLEQQQQQQRQVIPAQCSPPNFQWYTSYMQMQQALMLSTISQCCQMLWLQQQDLNSLINTVTIMQQRTKPTPTTTTINLTQPSSSSDAAASAACSLPTRLPSTNTEYPGLETRERASPPHNLTRNLPVGVAVMAQPHQPAWNGAQALNNQVAPGNRANNYWDNFRSYSRQNLLSTSAKSNEGSQNSLSMFDRSNASASFSQTVGTVHRVGQPSTLPKINMPIHEGLPLPAMEQLNNHHETPTESESSIGRSERAKPAKRNRAPCRNRNEWNEETPQPESSPQKSKLFEVLRENVYKEVTLLISANENRPHFLIQLFRDLQLISSDPLRRSALQSIQNLITQSFTGTASSSSPSHSAPCSSDDRVPITPVYAAAPPPPPPVPAAPAPAPSFRNKPEKTASRCYFQPSPVVEPPVGNFKLDPEAQRILIELLPFLKSHNDDVFHNGLMDMIKLMIFQLLPAKHSASSNKLQTKLDSLFTESLMKYKGKRIVEIKEELLKTIADILLEELPVTPPVKERPKTSTDMNYQTSPAENIPNPLMFLGEHTNSIPFEPFHFLQMDQKAHRNFSNGPRIDNGDLAEADQSRREAENEELGAVGGVVLLDAVTTAADTQSNSSIPEVNPSINELRSDLEMFINPDINKFPS